MRLVILGAGGYGRMIGDLAARTGRYEQIEYLDDDPAAPLAAGPLDSCLRRISGDAEFYPAFGDNGRRLAWLDRLAAAGARIPVLVHPAAWTSPGAVLEPGVAVLPGAVVNTGCHLKRGCLVNSGAVVDHDCVLEEGAHVCIGALVKAGNRIPRCLKVEAGEVVPNGRFPL